MSKKHVGKKFLSVTLVFALVLGMFGSYIGTDPQVARAAEPDNTKVLEKELEGYQRVSVNDFVVAGTSTYNTFSSAVSGTKITANKTTFYKGSAANELINADGYSLDRKYLDLDINTSNKSGLQHYLFNNAAGIKDRLTLNWVANSDTITLTQYKDTQPVSGQKLTVDLKEYGREERTDFFNMKLRIDAKANVVDSSKVDVTVQWWINNRYAGTLVCGATRMSTGFCEGDGNSKETYVRDPKYLKEEFAGYERVSLNEYKNETAGDRKYVTYKTISSKEEGTYITTNNRATYKGSSDTTLINANGYSLDKKYLELDINTNNITNMNHYFFNNGSCKDRLTMNWTANSDSITLTQYKDAAVVSGAVLTCDLSQYGRENRTDFFNMKLRIDAKTDATDSTRVDVTVQWWINDTYVGTLVCEDTQMGNMYREGNGGEAIAYYVREPISLEHALEGYDRLTIEDFEKLGAARTEEGTVYVSNKAGAYTGTGTFDKKYLDIDIKPYQDASANRNFLNYMMTPKKNDNGAYNAWGDADTRYQFEVEKDGSVLDLLYVTGGKGNARIKFNLTDCGYTDGDMLNLKIRTDIDINSANSEQYITFQLWLNDNCLGYAHFTESKERDMTCMGIRGVSATQPTTVRIPMNRVLLKDVSYDLKQGGYLLSGADTFLVNGEEKTTGTILNTAGTYTIERIINGKTATIQQVTLYESLDAAVPALTYDYLGGSDVMPIGGFYGPYSDANLTDDIFKAIADSGINLITYSPIDRVDDVNRLQQGLALAEKYGIGMYVTDSGLNTLEKDADGNVTGHTPLDTPETIAKQIAAYSVYDSFLGINLVDEPKPFSADDTNVRNYRYYTDIAKTLKSYANVTGYMNLFGSAGVSEKGTYSAYLSKIAPDVNILSFDNYPFHANLPQQGQYSDAQQTRISTYLESLDTVRQVAEEHQIPFMSCVQAGTDYRDSKADGETVNSITKEQTQWIVNTSLAYGAKGITWFPLVQPEFFSYDTTQDSGHDYDRNGIIGADGKTNKYYDMVKEVNQQVAAVDEVLMKAVNTGVIVTGSAASDVAIAAKNGSYHQNRGHNFTGIRKQENGTYTAKLKEVSSDVGAMVGCFDYQGLEAFYVVNYNYDEAASQTIALTFNGGHKYRIIQNAETTYGEGGEVSLTIPSGAGVLVVLEDYVAAYTPAEFEACRKGETFTASEAPEGYVFAGWFLDKACTKSVGASAKTVSQETVYAKFVDEKLLGVKAQISANTTAASENTDIRFVSAVDTLDYQKVGFVIEQEGMQSRDRSSKVVYAALSVYYEGDSQSYTPGKIFCETATRFKTYTLTGVPNAKFGVPFEVTAYWVTLDGTRVCGPKTSKVISSGLR